MYALGFEDAVAVQYAVAVSVIDSTDPGIGELFGARRTGECVAVNVGAFKRNAFFGGLCDDIGFCVYREG